MLQIFSKRIMTDTSDSEDGLTLIRVSSVTKSFEVVPAEKSYSFKFLGWGQDCWLEYRLKEGIILPHRAEIVHEGR